MPSIVSGGTHTATANSVPNPAAITPALPSTRSTDDWLFAFTECTSLTATVGASSGWNVVYSVLTGVGRLACFACKTTGSETVPTITWTGTTTGTSGTPCAGRVLNMGTGFQESAGLLTVDIISSIGTATAADVQAGGASFYTTLPNTWVIAHGMRSDDTVFSVAADTGGAPVLWTLVFASVTTSGIGMGFVGAAGIGPSGVGGLVMEHTWALSGAAAANSQGIMVALALPTPAGEPGLVAYTRGRAPA